MIVEKWCDTGERIEREPTAVELAQMEADKAAAEAAAAEAAAKAETDAIARNAAIAHAKSLGFTDAMIAVMYPDLGAES